VRGDPARPIGRTRTWQSSATAQAAHPRQRGPACGSTSSRTRRASEGIEILEFRHGNHFDMRITESNAGWDKMAEVVREMRDTWAAEVTDHE